VNVTTSWEMLDTGMRLFVGDPVKPATPVVVVLEHGPGIDAFIQDRVQRLAAHGWLAIAPDLFHRQPDDGAPPLERVARLRDAEIIADVLDRHLTPGAA
jgi:dienelactone hydrolase